MKTFRRILLSTILATACGMIPLVIYEVYLRYNYTVDGYKWIELRKSFPQDTWVQAKFVVIGNYGQETVVFNIPTERINAFVGLLEEEISRCPKMENPQWEIYQLRIVTIKGRYTTAAYFGDDKIVADSWMSYDLRYFLSKLKHVNIVPIQAK